ncbi:cell division protein ZapE [Candidatus Ichthyocystis sparus]|nr:cell division protein ZapE [Candidatus Ichthyocystis sparus]
MVDLKREYVDACVRNNYKETNSQLSALQAIESVINSIIERQTFWGRLTVDKPRSLYVYGPSGRGKTFLMDLVYEHFLLPDKRRLHFHEFMRSVQDYLGRNSQDNDPISAMIKSLDYRYLFLDEFYVSDIADAMILGRLLMKFDERDIFIMTTSNFAISQLYIDGLRRDSFMGTIDWMHEHYISVSMEEDVDFRREHKTSANSRFFSPHTAKSEAYFEEFFIDKNEGKIEINGRHISYYRIADSSIWFTYGSICNTSRSFRDYLLLSEMFSTFIISHIPEFNEFSLTHLRRFTFLIDVLYDRHRRLFISSSFPLEKWDYQGKFSDQFARTVSRLFEMRDNLF